MADTLSDLTGFQIDILIAIGRLGTPKGLAIRDELEELGYGEVHHGRLYPNLDKLVEKGLISKSERDKRTNEYSLSTRGRRELEEYLEWVESGIKNDE